MHIAMISHRGCVRVGKEATALMTKGIEVSSISFELPKWHDRFTEVILCSSREQLRRSVLASKADIFHIHNTPDWLVKEVGAVTDRPIVYDVHDPEVMRLGEPGDGEADAHQACNATVYPSDSCRIFTESYFKKTKPAITLHSYINEMYDYDPLEWPSWDSVVYEGGVSDNPESYRYYRDLFTAFQAIDFNVFLIPSGWAEDAGRYSNQVNVIGPLSYGILLRTMRSFGFGILGSQEYTKLMYAAMPNKLFEYIAAGVIPLCFNMGEASEYVKDYKIGLDMTELAGAPDKAISTDNLLKIGMEYRHNLLGLRKTLFLEDHIQPLIDLYYSL